MSTAIAQELVRIENAKKELVKTAGRMGLRYVDEDGGVSTESFNTETGETELQIGKVVSCFENIPLLDGSDVTVGGPNVSFPKGYYTSNVEKTVKPTDIKAPVIDIDGDTGEITATVSQDEGYIESGNKSATKQITHTNLTPENIKTGVSMFGVEGTFTKDATTFTGEQVDASTIKSDDISEGYTVYSQGKKVIGTMPTMRGSMGESISLNVLEKTHTTIANTRMVNVEFKITDDLLNRLNAI